MDREGGEKSQYIIVYQFTINNRGDMKIVKKTILIKGAKFWLMTASFIAMAVVFAPRAHALMMTLDDLGTPGIDAIIVDDVDGGIGFLTPKGLSNSPDLYAGDGALMFSGSVGSFIVNVTTGLSKPIIGHPGMARIDLNSVNVSGAAGVLEIMVTDTDFLALPYQDTEGVVLTNEWGGTADGEVTAQGWVDPGNANFGMGFSTGLQGPFGSGAFSDTVSILTAPFPGIAPFSLTEVVRITHTAPGMATSFDKSLTATPIPEPATMLLFGIGLITVAGIGKRKRSS